jgi:hypothetical protein
VTVEKESKRMEKREREKIWMKSSLKAEKVSKSEEKEQRIRRTAKGNKRQRE